MSISAVGSNSYSLPPTATSQTGGGGATTAVTKKNDHDADDGGASVNSATPSVTVPTASSYTVNKLG